MSGLTNKSKQSYSDAIKKFDEMILRYLHNVEAPVQENLLDQKIKSVSKDSIGDHYFKDQAEAKKLVGQTDTVERYYYSRAEMEAITNSLNHTDNMVADKFGLAPMTQVVYYKAGLFHSLLDKDAEGFQFFEIYRHQYNPPKFDMIFRVDGGSAFGYYDMSTDTPPASNANLNKAKK